MFRLCRSGVWTHHHAQRSPERYRPKALQKLTRNRLLNTDQLNAWQLFGNTYLHWLHRNLQWCVLEWTLLLRLAHQMVDQWQRESQFRSSLLKQLTMILITVSDFAEIPYKCYVNCYPRRNDGWTYCSGTLGEDSRTSTANELLSFRLFQLHQLHQSTGVQVCYDRVDHISFPEFSKLGRRNLQINKTYYRTDLAISLNWPTAWWVGVRGTKRQGPPLIIVVVSRRISDTQKKTTTIFNIECS